MVSHTRNESLNSGKVSASKATVRLVNWAIQNGDADFRIAKGLSPELSEPGNVYTSTALLTMVAHPILNLGIEWGSR